MGAFKYDWTLIDPIIVAHYKSGGYKTVAIELRKLGIDAPNCMTISGRAKSLGIVIGKGFNRTRNKGKKSKPKPSLTEWGIRARMAAIRRQNEKRHREEYCEGGEYEYSEPITRNVS